MALVALPPDDEGRGLPTAVCASVPADTRYRLPLLDRATVEEMLATAFEGTFVLRRSANRHDTTMVLSVARSGATAPLHIVYVLDDSDSPVKFVADMIANPTAVGNPGHQGHIRGQLIPLAVVERMRRLRLHLERPWCRGRHHVCAPFASDAVAAVMFAFLLGCNRDLAPTEQRRPAGAVTIERGPPPLGCPPPLPTAGPTCYPETLPTLPLEIWLRILELCNLGSLGCPPRPQRDGSPSLILRCPLTLTPGVDYGWWRDGCAMLNPRCALPCIGMNQASGMRPAVRNGVNGLCSVDGTPPLAHGRSKWGAGPRYRATSAFVAAAGDELSFKQGEEVEIVSKSSPIPGVWIGRLLSGRVGVFPADRVQEIPPPAGWREGPHIHKEGPSGTMVNSVKSLWI